jgi:hypothetical protein
LERVVLAAVAVTEVASSAVILVVTVTKMVSAFMVNSFIHF